MKKIISLGLIPVLAIGIFVFLPLTANAAIAKKITVTSPAFKNAKEIPAKYAFNGPDIPGGENVSIPLKWKVEKKTAKKIKSFAISIVDLHPIAQKFSHLLVVDLPADLRAVAEGAFSGQAPAPEGAINIANSSGEQGYFGPYPPPGSGLHNYEIIVYGLNVAKLEGVNPTLPLDGAAFKKLLKKKIVASGKMKGKFGVGD